MDKKEIAHWGGGIEKAVTSSYSLSRLAALLVLAPLAFAQQTAVTGSVVDPTGATIARAEVKLLLDGRGADQRTESDASGQFSFATVLPGPFRVAVSARGFAMQTVKGEAREGVTVTLPAIKMVVDAVTTDVNVSSDVEAIAEAQIKQAETQRFVGLVPNYFANYNPDAAPLNTRQKFELTWKTFLDPSAFVITGIIAGVQQAQNTHKGFGQGGQGYAKRYGSAYGDFVASVMVERVLMPTIFKQDPRYFYQGTGTNGSRARHALARVFVCQGDNKKAQFCYSRVITTLGLGFATNYIYPKADRNTNGDILRGAGISFGAEAMANLFQEFVAKKITKSKH